MTIRSVAVALALGLLAVAGLALVPDGLAAAYAQTATPAAPAAPTGTTVSLGGFFSPEMRELILGALGVVVTAVLGFLANKLNTATNINIDAKYRDSIHSAIMTGVSGALNFAQARADSVTVDVRNQIIADAIRYAQKAVPDALKALGVGHDTLVQLASSKLAILAEAPSSIPTNAAPTGKPSA